MRCSLLVCVFTCLWCPIAHGDLLDTYQNDLNAALTGRNADRLNLGYINDTYHADTGQILDDYVSRVCNPPVPGQTFGIGDVARQLLARKHSPGGLLLAIIVALNTVDGNRVPALCYLARALFENAELVKVAVPLEEFKQRLCYIAAEDTISPHAERPLQLRPQPEAEPRPIFEPQQLENLTNADYRCLFEDLHLIAKNKELIPLLCNHPQLQVEQGGEFIQTAPIDPALAAFPSADVHVSFVTKNDRKIKLSDLGRMAEFWDTSNARQDPLVIMYGGRHPEVLCHALDVLRVGKRTKGKTLDTPCASILIADGDTRQRFTEIVSAERAWPYGKWGRPISPMEIELQFSPELVGEPAAAQYPMELNLSAIICNPPGFEGCFVGGLVTIVSPEAEEINLQAVSDAGTQLTYQITRSIRFSKSPQLTVVIKNHARSEAWPYVLQEITASLQTALRDDYTRLRLVGLSAYDPKEVPTPDGIWRCGFYDPTHQPDIVSVLCGGGILQLRVSPPDALPVPPPVEPQVAPNIDQRELQVEPNVDQGEPPVEPNVDLAAPQVDPNVDQGAPPVEPRVDQGEPPVEPIGGQGEPPVEPNVDLAAPQVEPNVDQGEQSVAPLQEQREEKKKRCLLL